MQYWWSSYFESCDHTLCDDYFTNAAEQAAWRRRVRTAYLLFTLRRLLLWGGAASRLPKGVEGFAEKGGLTLPGVLGEKLDNELAGTLALPSI